MFRLSHYIKEIFNNSDVRKARPIYAQKKGPVVIWNLIRRCNLKCKHCYTSSLDKEYEGELSTVQAKKVIHNLKEADVPVIIFSGGEPLLREDIFELSHEAKRLGFYTALSTNGTLVDQTNLQKIVNANYNYIGISLDGVGEVHDKFRGVKGSFDKSLEAVKLCVENDIKVGVRFCINQYTAKDVDHIIQLVEDENINKLYMSHLNYSGRGKSIIHKNLHHQMTRETVGKLFDYALDCHLKNKKIEIVTGNNDTDAVYFLFWVKEKYPEAYDRIKAKLNKWGGNSTGIGIANIDNLGNVNPDSFWWNHPIGNVKEQDFHKIWTESDDPIMAKLKTRDRDLKGRCSKCSYTDICNGNSRVRAYQLTGDVLAEDPGCYLTESEIF